MLPTPEPASASSAPALRVPPVPKVLVVSAVIVLIAVGWQLQRRGILAHPEVLLGAAGEHKSTAMGIFILAYALTAAAGVPTLPFNLAAGWLWGPVQGGALSALAATVGATLSFTAARTLFGQPLRKRFDNKFLTWAQDEFTHKGWRFVAFIRLNPVFPTGPLNWLLGLTCIPARTYVCATAIFFLPPSIAVSWVGDAVAHLRSGVDPGRIMRVAMMISAAVTLLVGIRYGAKYLNYSRSKWHS